jgi:two-component system, NarL family, response regulator LiaR
MGRHRQEDQESMMERTAPVQEGQHAPQAYRILLVDDHTITREVLRCIVEGYAELSVVGEAINGLEAVAMAATNKPDVILMDVNMPWMNGIEATKHIKHAQPATIVIGLSDNNSIQVRDLMIEAGADGFLPKEAAQDQLYPLIAALTYSAV